MNITSLFGTTPRDTHDYVGWLMTNEGQEFLLNRYLSVKYSKPEVYRELVNEAHTFLSQPMKREWFERGEEPFKLIDSPYYPNTGQINPYWKMWQNWQPLFKGEWEIETMSKNGKDQTGILFNGELECFLEDCSTLNDFLTTTKHIEKEFNPEFDIQ